jgi:2'-5' RNA ligase
MPGYYIAAKVQEQERNKLPDVQQRAHDTAHMTLAYLGPLSPSEVKRTKVVLKQLSKKHRDFNAMFLDYGNFAGSNRKGIYYMGVKPTPQLISLQADIAKQLPKSDDKRKFNPHVTLDPKHSGPYIPNAKGQFKVNQISLLQIDKKPKTIHSYRLRNSNIFERVWDRLRND